MAHICRHLIGGRLVQSRSREMLAVTNPATGEIISRLPLATPDEVDQAIASASEAFQVWSRVSVVERSRVLFRFVRALQTHADELAELVVVDNGKTMAEAKGSIERGIEVAEYACGVVSHTMGAVVENVSVGVDMEMIRQPLGVVAGFTPFNFPFMVPMWMIPLAVACGNTFVLKPSERAPLASVRMAELFAQCGAPAGTLNVVHGASDVAEQIMAHAAVKAISVVGSSPIAKHVYATAAAHGKRVQALGGAKNALIVLPDAEMQHAVASITASVFGCAGQRCLAGANVVAVGEVAEPLLDRLAAAASELKLGSGLEPATTMGPVITEASRQRVIQYVDDAERAGARVVCDGRARSVPELPGGYFLGPTILDQVTFDMCVARDEVFGPVLNLIRVPDLDSAIAGVNSSPFGNSASLYSTSGRAAQQFRGEIQAGMLGVNLGVPAPSPFFPFSGWKESFFGSLHAQGKDGVEFYTRRKVVTSRWP